MTAAQHFGLVVHTPVQSARVMSFGNFIIFSHLPDIESSVLDQFWPVKPLITDECFKVIFTFVKGFPHSLWSSIIS
jgi:hypothetical protein